MFSFFRPNVPGFRASPQNDVLGFNVRPQDAVPGFNVRSQDDVPGFNVRPQDEVPGFDLDQNGVPRGDRTWSDGTEPGSATMQHVTPVNCTTVNGALNCTSPGGTSFGGNVKASPGFPDLLGPGVDEYHAYSLPDGPYPEAEQTLTQHVIIHPTPGPERLVKPATPEGTLNEATPISQWLYDYLVGNAAAAGAVLPPDGLINPVRSYLTTDQNGKPVVVNVTEPEHRLQPGYVVRSVTPSSEGATIQNEGEGASSWQGPDSQRFGLAGWLNDQAWGGLYQRQTGKKPSNSGR